MNRPTDRWIRWTTTSCAALLALITGTVSSGTHATNDAAGRRSHSLPPPPLRPGRARGNPDGAKTGIGDRIPYAR
jgi:hypothetical protein